jgi:outer membrane immunogenic protein
MEECEMKKFFAGICLLAVVLMGTSAFAGDFKGFYVGMYAGGAKGSSDATTTTVFDPAGYFNPASPADVARAGSQQIDPGGFTGGAQAGYNWQGTNWLVGLEGDFGALKVSDSGIGTTTYTCCGGTLNVGEKVTGNWVATIRPRVGYVHNNVLWYATGGFAVVNTTLRASFNDSFGATESGRATDNATGWTAGAGVEWKPGTHWGLKGEYLYLNVGDVTATSTNLNNGGPFPQNPFTHTADLSAHMFRVGFNYHF